MIPPKKGRDDNKEFHVRQVTSHTGSEFIIRIRIRRRIIKEVVSQYTRFVVRDKSEMKTRTKKKEEREEEV